MKSSPAFQFYPNDYLCSQKVAMMTLEEEGAYIRALSYCWKDGTIPADEEQLIRLVGKGCSTTVARVVQLCFVKDPEDPSRLRHERLDEEREIQRAWREKCSIGGQQSGKARKKKRIESLKNTKGSTKGSSRVVELNSNSSSSSSSSSSNNISSKEDIYTHDSKTELRPSVFLSEAERNSLLKTLAKEELNYWLDELAGVAEDNPAAWKKQYKNHAKVIRTWRKMKLEKGFIWNAQESGYRYPDRRGTNFKSAAQQNYQTTMDSVETILNECQQKGEI